MYYTIKIVVLTIQRVISLIYDILARNYSQQKITNWHVQMYIQNWYIYKYLPAHYGEPTYKPTPRDRFLSGMLSKPVLVPDIATSSWLLEGSARTGVGKRILHPRRPKTASHGRWVP